MLSGGIAHEIELVLLLLLAAVLGGVVGAQREIHGAPAGMRTHILVAFGSAMFTIISAEAVRGLAAYSGTGDVGAIDPTRIAAQIVAGIGFLGAGAIIKDGTTIRGLTTAASLWTVAAIGMAVGAREVIFAVAGTVIIVVALGPVGKVSARLAPRVLRRSRVRMRVASAEVIDDVTRALLAHGFDIGGVITEPLEDGSFEAILTVDATRASGTTGLLSVIHGVVGVISAETVASPD